jgi:hypothetical protein
VKNPALFALSYFGPPTIRIVFVERDVVFSQTCHIELSGALAKTNPGFLARGSHARE